MSDEQRVLIGRRLDGASHLIDDTRHDGGGRRPARRYPFEEVGTVFGQEMGERLEAQDGPFETLRRVDTLEARHVAGQVLWTRHLVHRLEVVDVMRVLAQPDPGDHLEHVEGDRVLLAEPNTVDLLGVLEEPLQATDLFGASFSRWIGQTVVVPLVAKHGGIDRMACQEPLPEPVRKVDYRTADC